ncbi:LysR family transcriptional regulator [Chitinasiproducens palmae]|uniref:DNA-binding transcriptional regulator, LysR family n=1 Tax=Chitinasiproducens palmae TaxID=1770053 RepID=A0A1H2PU89_9BURK|nr:LysR family transcriptional regulator [Chitinasiproducens palmae]SDV50365.1 DNA-binding transcriptional regulator, LysR family [Chitinasiproducens palmae]
MELRHLHYFVAVADTLHFGQAAETLHISQPPLSRQIALLEEELGVTLFERSRRHVRLTAAGERLRRDALDILSSVERAKRNALAAGLGESGTLSVGFMFAAAYSVVPQLTRAYTSAYPQVEVRLRESIPTLLADDLRAGDADVGIMYPPAQRDGLALRTVYREPLVVALPSWHPLAATGTCEIAQLRDESFIISPRKASAYIYDLIVGHCEDAGFTPRIRLETNFQQTIVNLVGQGLGIALVHRSIASTRPAHVTFCELADAPNVDVVLTWSNNNHNPCIDTFAQIAEEVWRVHLSEACPPAPA